MNDVFTPSSGASGSPAPYRCSRSCLPLRSYSILLACPLEPYTKSGLPSCTPTGEYSQSGQFHSITSVSVLFTTHPFGNRLLQGEQAPVLSFGAVKCHLPTHCSTKLETPLSEVDFGLSFSFFGGVTFLVTCLLPLFQPTSPQLGLQTW